MKIKIRILLISLLLPFFLFAETFTFQGIVKTVDGKDKNSLGDFLNLAVHFFSKTRYNQTAEEFHDFLSRSLGRFEFNDLYNSKYMKPSSNNYKSVTYSGVNTRDGFTVDLTQTGFEKIPLSGFGDYGVEYSLRKNTVSSVATGTYAKSNSYSGDLKLDQNFGTFSHEKGAILLGFLLSIIDMENLDKINLPPSQTFPNLKNPENRKVLDLLLADLPSISRFFNQYFEADSILNDMVVNDKRVTVFNLNGRINSRYVQNQYPFLASYLDDISSLGWIHLVLYNTSGNRIFEIRLESSTLLLYCKFYTAAGKIIPFTVVDGKDNLDFGKAFSLQTLSLYNFKIQASFRADIQGLEFENKNIWIDGTYRSKAGEGNLTFTLKEIPKTSISGGFSYILPAWAIDLVIPGNMEEIVSHFTTVLVHANQEKGSNLKFAWRKDPTHWLFSLRSESEFVDNFFIRFGLKVFNNKIYPSKQAGDELARFFVQIFELARKDLISLE